MVTFTFHIFLSYETLKTYFQTSAQEIRAILGHFPILSSDNSKTAWKIRVPV